ncbi:tyrosinase family protein [Rhizobium beringeri]
MHNNIGGWMPTWSSPRDPIFFMHHGNIDRIWATWNLRNVNSADRLWTEMPFTDNFYNVDGNFWSPKVSELYVPEELGYTYGFRNYFKVAAASAKTLALNDKLTSVIAATAANAAIAGVTTTSTENSKTATENAPLSLPFKIPAGALQDIFSQPPLPSGMDTMDFGAAQEQAASAPRVLAFLRDVEITSASTTSVRVFLGKNELKADTPVTDPHYVGSFAVLGHNGDHHGGVHPNSVLRPRPHGRYPACLWRKRTGGWRGHRPAAGSRRSRGGQTRHRKARETRNSHSVRLTFGRG